MMFCLRAMMVGLGFFGVVYCLLSLLVMCAWRLARLLCRNSAAGRARLLFAVRIGPLLGSALITIVFALPAFLLLERGRPVDEDFGTVLFSIGTILLLAAGLFRVLMANFSASRVVSGWIEGAQALDAGAIAPTLQVRRGPPLLLYGISKPRVLASENAVTLLSPRELQIAVRHEIGHLRSRDNLKKMIFYAAAFPGMASLDQAWQDAAEFAADEAAVSNCDEAIDLASALIKLADMAPMDQPAFTTGLLDRSALVRLRVKRLLDWDDDASCRAAQRRRWFVLSVLPLALAIVSYSVAHYGQSLLFTHQFTEWFIH
jgi:Zn-dependent protease with chaperone function